MDLKIELTTGWMRLKHLSGLYQDKIRTGITLCLVIYLAYVCAHLVLGVLINTQNQTVAITNISTPKPTTDNIDAYRNLFGQYQHTKVARKNYRKVKLTPLNLTLVGTVFRAKNALAIIKNGSAQPKIYKQGDSITPGVLLNSVAKDYVLIERGGKLEKILIKFKYISPNAKSNRKTIDLGAGDFKPKTSATSKLSSTQKRRLSGFFKEASSKPEGLLSLISIMPNFSDGKLAGFKLKSGKEKRLFKDLGFKESDIVTRINDITLDNLPASFQVTKLLKQTKNFDIYLDRQGEQHIITINLD